VGCGDKNAPEMGVKEIAWSAMPIRHAPVPDEGSWIDLLTLFH